MTKDQLIARITSGREHETRMKDKQAASKAVVEQLRREISDLQMEMDILKEDYPQIDKPAPMDIRQKMLNIEYALEARNTRFRAAKDEVNSQAYDVKMAGIHLNNAKTEYAQLMATDGSDREAMVEFVKKTPLNAMTVEQKKTAFDVLGGTAGVIEAGGSYA